MLSLCCWLTGLIRFIWSTIYLPGALLMAKHLCTIPSSYAEALTPNARVLGGGALERQV